MHFFTHMGACAQVQLGGEPVSGWLLPYMGCGKSARQA